MCWTCMASDIGRLMDSDRMREEIEIASSYVTGTSVAEARVLFSNSKHFDDTFNTPPRIPG